MWSRDRPHGNAEGHARIAGGFWRSCSACSGADDAWLDPLPDSPLLDRRARLADHVAWGRTYFSAPGQELVARPSAGDGVVPTTCWLEPM